jgi:hypothetical protein
MMMMKNDESNSTSKAFSSTPSNLCKISIFCIGVVAEDDGYRRLNGLCKAKSCLFVPLVYNASNFWLVTSPVDSK